MWPEDRPALGPGTKGGEESVGGPVRPSGASRHGRGEGIRLETLQIFEETAVTLRVPHMLSDTITNEIRSPLPGRSLCEVDGLVLCRPQLLPGPKSGLSF